MKIEQAISAWHAANDGLLDDGADCWDEDNLLAALRTAWDDDDRDYELDPLGIVRIDANGYREYPPVYRPCTHEAGYHHS